MGNEVKFGKPQTVQLTLTKLIHISRNYAKKSQWAEPFKKHSRTNSCCMALFPNPLKHSMFIKKHLFLLLHIIITAKENILV